MSKLSKLSKAQLDKMLVDTQNELNRRKSITKATQEIRAILKKYSITAADIDSTALKLSADNPRKVIAGDKKGIKGRSTKDNRASVAPKYKSLDGREKWTGRGLAPKWVVRQCESLGISLDTFKTDERFILK